MKMRKRNVVKQKLTTRKMRKLRNRLPNGNKVCRLQKNVTHAHVPVCEESSNALSSADADVQQVQTRIDKIREDCVGKIQKRLEEVKKEIKEIDVCVEHSAL